MFFNVNGIKWTLLALVGVAVFCALDLHCSMRRDEASAAPVQGTISRVKSEMKAGKREYASLRAEQLEEQLRGMRALAKKLVREGKDADARRVITTIMEMEKDANRLRERAQAE